MTKKLVVLGLGQRGNIYATFAKTYPEKFELAAIIENNPERIAYAEKEFGGVKVFTDYKDFLNDNIAADIVAVATQDDDHKEHAIAMMKAGYDLLLEKPIANNKQDCLEIYEASKKYDRKVIVCHVLRYTPFYSRVKRIIDSGKLGDIVTVNASENVGYYHQAHSFVRGPWRNKEQSSPMILAKCCHDMDIIRYLTGESVRRFLPTAACISSIKNTPLRRVRITVPTARLRTARSRRKKYISRKKAISSRIILPRRSIRKRIFCTI